MPGENIQDWSTTAADNDDADSLINWVEHQPRASVNDSARSMMAAHAKKLNLENGSITTTGTADAQAFTSGVGFTSVPTGLRVLLKLGVGPNTGSATLNMDGIGAATIKSPLGVDLIGNELSLNSYAEFLYDGTNWILLSVPGGTSLTILNNTTVLVSAPVSTIDFTTRIDNTYDHYMFDFFGITGSVNGAIFAARLSIDGGATFVSTSSYLWAVTRATSNPPGGYFNGGTTVYFQLCTDISNSISNTAQGILELLQPSSATTNKTMFSRGASWDPSPSGAVVRTTGCVFNNLNPVNAIRFMMSSGTITSGTINMYGIKKGSS